MIHLFEGVSVTTVILAPGACGMGGPSSGSCHHFGGFRREFQIHRSCWYTRDFGARELPKTGPGIQWGPIGYTDTQQVYSHPTTIQTTNYSTDNQLLYRQPTAIQTTNYFT